MRVVVIGWKQEDADARAAALRRDGCEAEALVPAGPKALKALSADPPAVLVIDLERRPAQGRDLGLWLRSRKATRAIPLVFAGGEAVMFSKIKELLPDAEFAAWEKVTEAVRSVREKVRNYAPAFEV